MKTMIKLAVIGALVAGGGAANAAIFNTSVTTPGGGDLELFVTDKTTNTYFALDLGNQLDTIYSKAQVIADGVQPHNTPGTFKTPTSIGGINSTLASYLGTTATSDDVEWTILAADRSSTNVNLGSQRMLITSTDDISGAGGGSTPTNLQTGSTFTSKLNTLNTNINNLYTSGNSSTDDGWWAPTTDGANSQVSWSAFPNSAAIGSKATMFLYATNGSGNNNFANVYVGGTVEIDRNGLISVANSPVPLPAAVWLLGSGLLGLAGVSRRRSA